MTPDDARSLVDQGKAVGRRLAGRGLICLGEVGIGNTTVAAALSCALLGLKPEDAAGLGAGADTAMVRRKQEVIARAVNRASAEHGDRLRDPWVLTASLGGPEVALPAGVTLGAPLNAVVPAVDAVIIGRQNLDGGTGTACADAAAAGDAALGEQALDAHAGARVSEADENYLVGDLSGQVVCL